VTVHLSDLVWGDDGSIHALWGYTSSELILDSMAQSLRNGDKGMTAVVLNSYDQPDYSAAQVRDSNGWYRYPTRTFITSTTLYHARLAGSGEDFILNRVHVSSAIWQMAMYPHSATTTSELPQFTLLLRASDSEETWWEQIFESFNRRLAVPIAKEWTPAIWEYLVGRRRIEQLHSFGQVLGFHVILEEDMVREFLGTQIREGNLRLPGIEPRVRERAA
jgi:hypothetical protein